MPCVIICLFVFKLCLKLDNSGSPVEFSFDRIRNVMVDFHDERDDKVQHDINLNDPKRYEEECRPSTLHDVHVHITCDVPVVDNHLREECH